MSGDSSIYRQIKVNVRNFRKQNCICCTRRVELYKDNKVTTSKYNVLTFLPLNLMLQFSKMANFYFLVLTMMELYKPISDSGGIPVLAVPLGFVVSISMIKDIYEDIMRHRQDSDENNRKVEMSETKIEGKKKEEKREVHFFKKTRWQNIKVGKIVKVYEN
jgi:phospholipid-transporting ATPase